MDYVEQNIRTIQKQLEMAEKKLVTASIVSTPEVLNEEGLPLTEIMEELDDDGNVISSSTSTAGSAKPQLLEVLKKAGVELPANASPSSSAAAAQSPPKIASAMETKPKTTAMKPAKQGVSFAEDTKPGPEPLKSQTAKRVEEIMSVAKRSETMPSEQAVIPEEPEDDAAMRRQMLQYGMSEVGAVVAELELEDGSDWDDEDYEDDDTSDEEDALGRSTRKVVDDELRQRMIELEERLGVRMMENVGQKASDVDIVEEGIGRITISKQPADSAEKVDGDDSSSKSENGSSKKSVRFSEELDISPALESVAAPATVERTAPVSDIVERTAHVQATTTPKPQKKQSRFKSARATAANVVNGPLAPSSTRQAGPSLPLFPAKSSTPKPFSQPIAFAPVSENVRPVPTGPEGTTLASKVIEREVQSNPTEPDELDPQLLHQEVATEYHRQRNRMIQRQGGFMQEEESEIVPFTEQEGGPKKMSRFKAARLAKS
jgi:unconventional prefoldin RPB5 interactor 1